MYEGVCESISLRRVGTALIRVEKGPVDPSCGERCVPMAGTVTQNLEDIYT
jgi:hypothetical protein